MKQATITINEDGSVRMDTKDGSSQVAAAADYNKLRQIVLGMLHEWECWVELNK